jgi:hypothetical protein
VASNLDPTPKRIRFASAGTALVRSVVWASPRASSSRSAAFAARASHTDDRVEISLSSMNFSSRRRSRAAIVRVQAAYTTGTSSRGTTNSVRRMPSMRKRTRSS